MLCNLPKIISFSGRKHSGKTELAKVCMKYNYELINFADSLKELICDSLEITREYLEQYKDTIVENDLKYDLSKKITYISDKINVEESVVSNYLSKPFDSIRKILQIIGTDLIRNYNHLWHINQIKQKILSNPGKYYCIGDCRFLNEKKMVEDLNGECWFIIRPNMFEISNHYSEINLKWTDFENNIIINNINKELLIQKWQNYLESLKYDTLSKSILNTFSKKELRCILVNLLKDYSPREISLNLNYNSDEIIWWCNNLMIQFNKEQYRYNINTFLETTEESSYVMGLLYTNGYMKKYNGFCNYTMNLDSTNKYIVEMYRKVLGSDKPIYVNNKKIYSFECDDPFIIENIKLWNFNPHKSINKEIPFLLENNLEMLKCWIIGLIDGDGYIRLHNKTLTISILASKQVIQYLISILPDDNMYQYNSYDNLDELNFLNYNCINLYRWLGTAVNLGLKKKWNKVNKYMQTFNLTIT